MSRYHTYTSLIVGAAGLVALAGCTGSTTTLAAPVAPRLKVPAWARTAPPLSEQLAAQLIRDYGVRQKGDVLLPRDPAEVKVIRGAFTHPGAQEAVASFQSGLAGERAWQTWLLEWRDMGWQAVRRVTSACEGHVERAQLDRRGAAVLLLRESCMRFGDEEGQLRLIALGAEGDLDLFVANERSFLDQRGERVKIRHSVWLTGFDALGKADLVDLAFTERRLRPQGDGQVTTLIASTVSTFRLEGNRLMAVSPDHDGPAPVRVVTASR